MKVAIDARELAERPTGVGRYLAELLDRWSVDRTAARHEWRLYAHRAIRVPAPFQTQAFVLPGTGGTGWEQRTFSAALRRDKPDVVFAPGYTAPLTAPAPIAVTIHDVSFLAHPEWFSFREGLRRRTLTKWTARRSRVVLTDSRFSCDEIVRHIGVPPDRVRVIPLGLPRPRVAPGSSVREPIILYVGSIFQRRHVDRLIEVFVTHIAPRIPDSRLEIVGANRLHPPGDPARALQTCGPAIAARVTIRSYVDDATLDVLYRRAAVFAFLSEYEGFGLTPLEALAAGVPPVVLDTPVAREVYADAARYVTTIATDEPLAEALLGLLSNTTARTEILANAEPVLARYDWDRTATATLHAIEEAAGV